MGLISYPDLPRPRVKQSEIWVRDYNGLTIRGQTHLRPMTLPHWTNQNVFSLLSPTTQPFAPSCSLFANTFTSLFHPLVAVSTSTCVSYNKTRSTSISINTKKADKFVLLVLVLSYVSCCVVCRMCPSLQLGPHTSVR